MAMSNDLDDMLTLDGQRAKEASVNRASTLRAGRHAYL